MSLIGKKVITIVLGIVLITVSIGTYFYLSREGVIDVGNEKSLEEVYWPTPGSIVDLGWKPDDSYSLVVLSNMLLKMEEVNNSDGVAFSVLSRDWYEFEAMAWRPDGSYALIVGGEKNIAKFGDNGLTNQSYTTNTKPFQRLKDVAWKPNGEYSLIVGSYSEEPYLYDGLILKYDGTNFESIEYQSEINCSFEHVIWKPDGSYALIIDGYGSIIKYDGKTVTELYHSDSIRLLGASWRHDGTYALIVGNSSDRQGLVLKFDGNTFTDLSNQYQVTGNQYLKDVAWKPDDNYALIAGEANDCGFLMKYESSDFITIASGNDEIEDLTKIVWNDDYAVVIGRMGVSTGWESILARYDGTKTTTIVAGMPSDIYELAWKPDGTYVLALASYGTLTPTLLWKYDGKNFTLIPWVVDGHGLSADYFRYGHFERIAWKPDGSYALIVGDDTVVKFDGNHIYKLFERSAIFKDVEWKPDGSYALIVDLRGVLYKFDGTALIELYRTFVDSPALGNINLRGISWNSDGSKALIVGEYGLVLEFDGDNITVVDTSKYFIKDQQPGMNCFLGDVDFQPNNDEALIVGILKMWKYENGTISELKNDTIVMTLQGTEFRISYSPDGTSALMLSGRLIKYDGKNFTIIGEEPIQGGIAWNPDGSYALIAPLLEDKVYKYVPSR